MHPCIQCLGFLQRLEICSRWWVTVNVYLNSALSWILGAFQCGVLLFSQSLRGFSPATSVSPPRSPKSDRRLWIAPRCECVRVNDVCVWMVNEPILNWQSWQTQSSQVAFTLFTPIHTMVSEAVIQGPAALTIHMHSHTSAPVWCSISRLRILQDLGCWASDRTTDLSINGSLHAPAIDWRPVQHN